MFDFLRGFKLVKRPKILDGISPDWEKFAKEYIKTNGNQCALCSAETKLNLHTIIPPSLAPELEFEPSNLIILCENQFLNCHLLGGHMWDWNSYNPDIRADIQEFKKRLGRRP